MNNTMGQPESASADSGPSTIEIIIGLLALVLALAAVVVGVAQYLQARTARRRQSDPESGQADIEMVPVVPSNASDTDSVTSNHR
jgi:hypothetical protein